MSEARPENWNHRVTRERLDDGSYWYAVREVFYDHKGNVTLWTEDAIAAEGETPGEVASALGQMAGCLALGVLDLETRETLPPSLRSPAVSS